MLRVIPAQARICPLCGAEVEVTKTELDIDKQAELSDVTKFQPFKANYIITKRPSELKTQEELEEYARVKGYKRGWIWYQMKTRGWVK